MTHTVEYIDDTTVRITESVATATEYNVTTLQKQRARLVEWTAKLVSEREAEIAEIDRILNMINEATP